jgi:hypothetical protein
MPTQIFNIDLTSAEGHNAIRDSDGVWKARPGFVQLGTWANLWYGASAQSVGGELYHYIFANDAVGSNTVNCEIYDSEWVLVSKTENICVITDESTPWTHAIVYNQLVVNSPGLSVPLWGWIGGPLQRADAQPSLSEDTPAITLFAGLVCQFSDRIAWAIANQVYINDPGTEPRTITTLNAIGLSGKITDLFQAGSGGELIIVTTDGVYTLAPDAISGFQLAGQINRTTHYTSLDYRNAGTCRGQVLGLGADGLVDLRSGATRKLVVNRRARHILPYPGPGRSTDYRTGQMHATDNGFFIAFGTGEPLCFLDLDSGGVAWWTDSDGYAAAPLRAVLRDYSGAPILLLGNAANILYGDQLGSNVCGLALEAPVPGYGSYVVREITVTAWGDGYSEVGAAVRDVERTTVPPAPPGAALANVARWDAANTIEGEYRSRRMQFAERLDGIYCEIRLSDDAKLQNVQLVTRNQGAKRPTN